MNPAKSARLNKEAHPERYCASPNCLWRLSSGNCLKHMKPRVVTTSNATDPFVETLEGMAYRSKLCLRCKVDPPMSNSMLCVECDADAAKLYDAKTTGGAW